MGQYTVAGSGADCKSAGETLGWFDSNLAHQNGRYPMECRLRSSHHLWSVERKTAVRNAVKSSGLPVRLGPAPTSRV